jgi:hypothetical protein
MCVSCWLSRIRTFESHERCLSHEFVSNTSKEQFMITIATEWREVLTARTAMLRLVVFPLSRKRRLTSQSYHPARLVFVMYSDWNQGAPVDRIFFWGGSLYSSYRVKTLSQLLSCWTLKRHNRLCLHGALLGYFYLFSMCKISPDDSNGRNRLHYLNNRPLRDSVEVT